MSRIQLGRRKLAQLCALTATALSGQAHADTAGTPAVAQAIAPAWAVPLDSAPVYGHTDRHSVVQGEPIDLMLALQPHHAPVRASVRLSRIGDYPWGRKLVWTSPPLTLSHRPVPRSVAASGTGWAPVVSADTTDWPPGVYTADVAIEGATDPCYNVVQTLVRPPKPRGDVLVKLSTNTWQAYNAWGGHSLYPTEDEALRGILVSFDRPGPASFLEYEVHLVTWLESLAARAGFSVDYAANFDVHAEPDLLDAYRLVVCGSHDEYWSMEEFDAFERRILQRGGNTIFTGANTGYWQVRYADIDRAPGTPDRGRQLVCHKSRNDPIGRRGGPADPLLLVTAMFRDAGRRPESMLMGAAYQNWFQPQPDGGPRVPYRVARTDLPFFRDTGLSVGDVVADVVGYEWDNRDPDNDGRRLFRPNISRIAELPPDSVQVLFTGTPVGHDGAPGLAEAVYFRSPAGAKVFNAGSVRWAWGLSRPGFATEAFQRFNANLFADFLT
ncbi:MAG: hypothetical protein JSS43_11740 [Proteobacteria bacterium]|nr:hypothetical protein [Pseudomonadota bacterium]